MREFGSEHPSVILPDGYFESLSRFGRCTWLRSGREALHLIALNLNKDNNSPIVMVPAYSCHSMVDPFERAGWRVEFYCLNRDLTADLNSLTSLLVKYRPKAVLTMNYFGSASTSEMITVIKQISPDCIVIEDFSHCTFSLDSIFNPLVDYYVTSIRKSVGVCDGALIIGHDSLDESNVLEEETDFVRSRLHCQKLKFGYSYSQDASEKEIFYNELRRQEGVLDGFSCVHRLSKTGKEMLQFLNGEMIRFARRENMKHILSLLNGKVESVPGIERCLNGAPFSFPILVKERDSKQRELAQKGVFAPVLWPISQDARNICPVSAMMSDEMLSIPVDQRYNYDDIEELASVVLSVCSYND